ncbi:hypothetical protein Tco_1504356, partial [Tanacetum coccineum]
KWQYFDISHDRLPSIIRGGCSKVFAIFSVARISLGLLDKLERSPWLGPWPSTLDSLLTWLPSLFRASSNSTTLPLCLRIPIQCRGLGLAKVEARLVSGVFLGVLAVKLEIVMGGSSPTFRPSKGVSVEKLSVGDSTLPFVMLEK